MYQVLNDLAPNALANLFVRKSGITDYEPRGSIASLQIPFPRTENLKKFFLLWNSLPPDLCDSYSLLIFKNGITAHNF
jgi:hypothetical protein